jgi:hypothetical protein
LKLEILIANNKNPKSLETRHESSFQTIVMNEPTTPQGPPTSQRRMQKSTNLKEPTYSSSRSKRQQKKKGFWKELLCTTLIVMICYLFLFWELVFFLPKSNSINKWQVATQS